MNNYKEALSSILFTMHNRVKPKKLGYCEDTNFEILQELVEKATPKKPLDVQEPVLKWGLCPNCKGELDMFHGRPNRVLLNEKYCRDCGQAIDWSDGSEEE